MFSPSECSWSVHVVYSRLRQHWKNVWRVIFTTEIKSIWTGNKAYILLVQRTQWKQLDLYIKTLKKKYKCIIFLGVYCFGKKYNFTNYTFILLFYVCMSVNVCKAQYLQLTVSIQFGEWIHQWCHLTNPCDGWRALRPNLCFSNQVFL